MSLMCLFFFFLPQLFFKKEKKILNLVQIPRAQQNEPSGHNRSSLSSGYLRKSAYASLKYAYLE